MLTALSIISLGFFLGMRHATDPDHVIAITTIVSRERTVARAAATTLMAPQVSGLILALVALGAVSIFGLQRLLGSEEDSRR